MRKIAELMDLQGRRALVVGGAGHIGRVIAEGFLELGAQVAILDIDAASCQKAVEHLAGAGGKRATAVSCDLSNMPDTQAAVGKLLKQTGGLDIVVHCAALGGTPPVSGWSVPFDQQSVEAWDAALRVNLTSAFYIVQQTQKALADSGHGSAIFLSSIYGIVGPDHRLYEGTSMANPAAYGASKAGLLQLTRHLATTLAPKVRVNAISPGGVWRDQPDAFVKKYISRTPLGRMATEEDIKGAAVYLASDLSAYVTGQNLVVDGGWTAW